MEFLLGQLSGFLLGLGASFISWWILVHAIVPKVEYGTFISKIDVEGRKYYRVKFKNTGKRDIIDGYAIAVLSVRGLHRRNWISFRIPLNVSGETTVPIPLLPKSDDRIFTLHLGRCLELQEHQYLPAEIRESAGQGKLTLEGLFGLGESRLRLYVAGSDAISVARKVFRSRPYTAADIRESIFRGLGPEEPPVENPPVPPSPD